MLVSKNWLQDFVSLPAALTMEQLALDLTMKVVEVEGFEEQGNNLRHIVVGLIKKIEKHPNADKLRVCIVDTGGDEYQVVCGGSNVRIGMKVVFGKIGATVKWHGEGELQELKNIEIRGVESAGMICASREVGLHELIPQESTNEIIDVSAYEKQMGVVYTVGVPLQEAFGLDDVIFDIDNKSMTHRPDLWGHYGLSREIAAVYGQKLKFYETKDVKAGDDLNLEVTIEDTKLCPRYTAVALNGITVGPSPNWMQKRLHAAGVRPINNIVDITNYVMLELGQPMHAFDAMYLSEEVEGGKRKPNVEIVIRTADKGEEFIALDEKKYDLVDTMLVVSCNGKAVALAGIVGGEASGVDEETTTVVFESANFDATNVRRTAKALGVRTDSSARFEKSLDPSNTTRALKRAVSLVLKLCPNAKVISTVADSGEIKVGQGPIEVSLDFIRQKMGVAVEKKEVIDILEKLGFVVKEKKQLFFITVPSWRATKDISIPEDIVEEVARMYGYEHIDPVLPTFPITPPPINELRLAERSIRELLVYEYGYTEVYTYSFVSAEWLKKLGLTSDQHIELKNPIAKDRPFVRRNLIPNVLQNVEDNLHRYETVRLFEIGRTYTKEEGGERAEPNSKELLPKQDTILAIAYSSKGDEQPFYEVAQAIRGVLTRLGVEVMLEAIPPQAELTHPGRHARIIVGDTDIGRIAELHPKVQEAVGIPYRTGMLQVNISVLLSFLKDTTGYEPLPHYPVVKRDIAFVVGNTAQHQMVSKALQDVDPLIVAVELFDVYKGKGLEQGKKSMAYHIVYRSDEHTLKAEDIDVIHKKVGDVLEEKFKAKIRK